LVKYYPKQAKDPKKIKAGRIRQRKSAIAEIAHQRNDLFEPEITTLWIFPQCDSEYGGPYPGRLPGQAVKNLLHHNISRRSNFCFFGRMPGQVVENLLHLCKIKKGELVVDPMAGRPSTYANPRAYGAPLLPTWGEILLT
jgi:hypothetical protein